MNPKFDLLGDPIPENHGEPGANGHIATKENVKKVKLLLVSGFEKKDIAAELGISVPTLNKHYFRSGLKGVKAARKKALAEEKAANLLRLDQAASKGNVTAIRELNSILAAEAMKDLAREVAGDETGETKPKPAPSSAPRGKKQQQADAAVRAIAGNPLLDPKSVH
ncbi:hypothetical protein [Tateyamaria sp. syn59]|uniref:hypothetical protein n=1 Tax=Tateyamaria sp. syn59 TaxID=2576942 RepID=UPI0011BF2DC8|nr:hypothetical protein [Tateyamaria sp. syn59]